MVTSQARRDQVALAMERGPPHSLASVRATTSVAMPTQGTTFEDEICTTQLGGRMN